MHLPFIIFIGILLISSSWGYMSSREFENSIEKMCFRLSNQNLPYINGQENPLASTLENFIALAEKFEFANPNKDLKEELFFFIRNFTYPNIEYNSLGDINQWQPKEADNSDVEKLWEPNDELRLSIPIVEDPFTDGEKCSLFNMLSHSIIRTPRKTMEQRSPVKNQNTTTDSSFNEYRLRSDFSYNDDDLYPLEQGVVAIQGSEEAVDLARVLTGIYVGLNANRQKEITEYTKIPSNAIPQTGTTLDPLYTLTIAEVIAMAGWRPEAGFRQLLAKNGFWKSVAIGSELETSSICPMIYRLPDNTASAYSYSSMRGAADGLILGKSIYGMKAKRNDIKLSQILRQYYTRGGFAGKTEEGFIHASFCNREDIVSKWENNIKEQVLLYILLTRTKYNNIDDSATFSWSQYTDAKQSGVYRNNNAGIRDYCAASLSENKPEDLPLETPLDIIVVLNTETTAANFKKQQLIIGSLASKLQLSYQGSRMTVFTDQKGSQPSVSTPGVIYLKTIVDQTYSRACAACAITQIENDPTTSLPNDQVILALNQYFTAKGENETQYSGVNGKVLILFDFEKEPPPPGRLQTQYVRLQKALTDLHLSHPDLFIYPLGENADVLKKYSRGDDTYVMSAFNAEAEVISKQLYSKIIAAPATLQYSDCEKAQNEKSAIYENYISPNAIQHWFMPAKYFYKSFNLKFTFESLNGPAKVCLNKVVKDGENIGKTCHELGKDAVQFLDKDPCKGLTALNCPPFYFSIIGINETETRTTRDYCDDRTTEIKCKTMDQIKFKISHEGIRCSGSMGLIATPVFLLLAFIISHLFSRSA